MLNKNELSAIMKKAHVMTKNLLNYITSITDSNLAYA